MERKLTEVMTLPLPETKEQTLSKTSYKRLAEFAKKCDSIAIGPGLSQNKETQALIRSLIKNIDIPKVIDADGLNALLGHLDILKDSVVTPHPGEMSRLIGRSISFINKNKKTVAKNFASEYNVTIVLKGYRSIVASTKKDKEIIISNSELIKEELNIKEVKIAENEDEIVDINLKPDFKVLGPRFGKNMKDVITSLKKLSKKEISEFRSSKEVDISLNGENIKLTLDEVFVEIPFGHGIKSSIQSFFRKKLVEFTCTAAFDMHFFKYWKTDIEIQFAKFLNRHALQRFLPSKIVRREGQDFKVIIFKFFIQLFQVLKLRGKSTLRSSVDNQKYLATIVRQIN